MEFLVVKGEHDVVGGCQVTSGRVNFNVPLRLILAKRVEFNDLEELNALSIEERINSYGRKQGDNRWQDVRVVRSLIPAGCYFKRIARPTTDHPNDPPMGFGMVESQRIEFQQSLSQIRSFLELLESIFEVVQPDEKHFSSYGVKIRNLLILASTEFEAIAKSVLRENGYAKDKTSIRDYEKIELATRLSQYSVRFSEYPALPTFRPFDDWCSGRKLGWYSDYNEAKHDRYSHFKKANLKNAICAVSGCLALLSACYGVGCVHRGIGNRNFGAQVVEYPKWEIEHLYRRARSRSKNAHEFAVDSVSEPINFNFDE